MARQNKKQKYKRSPAEIKADSVFIAELYLKENTHQQITDKLCELRGDEDYISRSTVTRDLQKMVKEWEQLRNDFINDAKLNALIKIDNMESKLWDMYDEMIDAWERSKEFSLSKSQQIGKKDNSTIKELDDGITKAVPADTPDTLEQQNTIIQTPGEVHYMQEARRIMDSISKVCERRTKLLGLDKIKIELEGNMKVQQIVGMKII